VTDAEISGLKLEFLQGCADIQMNRGDVFCIHTPGGGGYGRLEKE
jgi:N-methylhydantoinase B/oxoprolinase/acetone carboxylase alpha subunit